jgi:hypothetical protein
MSAARRVSVSQYEPMCCEARGPAPGYSPSIHSLVGISQHQMPYNKTLSSPAGIEDAF